MAQTNLTLRSLGSRAVVGLIATTILAGTTLAADFIPTTYRVQHAIGKFDDTSGVMIAYGLRAPRALRAHHLEVAVGSVVSSDRSAAVVSVGPVWRFPLAAGRAFVDFGFSPTLLSDSRFDDRELGGNFHFTSSLSIGASFGRFDRYSLALRAQHTSNGGLNEDNPGLDMFGLNFAVDFADF